MSKFTRQSYIDIARILARQMPESDQVSNGMINAFVDLFIKDNPRFDEKRFRERIEWEREHNG